MIKFILHVLRNMCYRGMCVHSVLMVFQHKEKEADLARKRFAGESRSDHIAYYNAYKVPTQSTA